MDDTETQATGEVTPSQEDTGTTQPSEASESSKETPEATQGNEETKSETGIKAEDTVEDKLYAGKYKSVEELEKAYKNAESKLGQETSQKAELSRALNEVFSSSAEGQSAETEVDPYNETTASPKAEKMERDMAVMKFIFTHEDADAGAMKEVLSSDPLVEQITGHDAKLEYAFLRSKDMSREKALAKAKQEGQQQAAAKTAEKEVAKVESAKKAEPVDEQGELMRQATSGTPDERARARQAIIRRDLINL